MGSGMILPIDYASADCEYCHASHTRRLMAAHQSECSRRPIKCSECQEDVPFITLTDHRTNTCAAAIVTCQAFTLPPDSEVKGCGVSMKRSELADHQKNQCSQTIICCPYSTLGTKLMFVLLHCVN
jgi:hypothetical protein